MEWSREESPAESKDLKEAKRVSCQDIRAGGALSMQR